ncbi:hypothetical protein BHE74_00007159 [Ensete ventricosum]|nr:hypothetical protein BHE74_00007159 [Ensete ventricosum]
MEFLGMLENGHIKIDDILLLFIYLELGAMVGIYFKTNHMPVRFLIYVAITALTRLLISNVSHHNPPDIGIIYLCGGILLLAFSILVPGNREGRALKPDAEGQGTGGRSLQQFVIAIGHHRQDLHGAVALLDGNAELNALYQAFKPLRVVALLGADHALGHHTRLIGKSEHDAAIQPLDAQVDTVVWRESVGDDLKRIVHGALPPDKNMQSLTTGIGNSSRLLTTGHFVAEVFARSVFLNSCTAKGVPCGALPAYGAPI